MLLECRSVSLFFSGNNHDTSCSNLGQLPQKLVCLCSMTSRISKVIFLASYWMVAVCCLAQEPLPDWGVQFGGENADIQPAAITHDETGAVYHTGEIKWDTIDIDPGPDTQLMSPWVGRGYVAKFDDHGKFKWARQFGGYSTTRPTAIKYHPDGYVVTTGRFNNQADFDPGNGTQILGWPQSGFNIYVSKFDSTGALLWHKCIGGLDFEGPTDMALDDAGNIYLTGWFEETVDFDPSSGTYNLSSPGNDDMFICKLDNDGELVWVKQIGADYNVNPSSINLGQNGNLYLTGFYTNNTDFDPDTGTYILSPLTNGGSDGFVLNLDTSGAFNWVIRFGTPNGHAVIQHAKLQSTGDIILGGLVAGTADFDPGSSTQYISNADGMLLVASYTPTGDLNFVKQFGASNNYPQMQNLDLDANGFIYNTGRFGGPGDTVDMNPGPDTLLLAAAAGLDGFVSTGYIQVLDSNGFLHWVDQFDFITGGAGWMNLPSLSVRDNGVIYSSTFFSGKVDLDLSDDSLLLDCDVNDRYGSIMKYNWCNSRSVHYDTVCDYVQSPTGKIWNTAGLHRDTLSNAAGCDSIYSLFLAKHPSTDSADLIAACDSFYWPVTGQFYTQEGSFVQAYQNTSGCDSIHTLELELHFSSTSNDSVLGCEEYYWEPSGLTYTQPGVYMINFASSHGCDSLQYLHLELQEHTAGITQSGDTLLALNGTAHQWIICDSFVQPIAGATDPFFVAPSSGSYAVVSDDGICSDTSDCIYVSALFVETIGQLGAKVYPNPFCKQLFVEVDRPARVSVCNSIGELVQTNTLPSQGVFNVDLNVPPGLYMLLIESGSGEKHVHRIIHQR